MDTARPVPLYAVVAVPAKGTPGHSKAAPQPQYIRMAKTPEVFANSLKKE
jgi:hypothetical protein